MTSATGCGMTACMLSSTMPLCFFLGAVLWLFPRAGVWVMVVWIATIVLRRR